MIIGHKIGQPSLPISHDLEDVVGVSNANLERDTLGTMQIEDGEGEPGPKQPP